MTSTRSPLADELAVLRSDGQFSKLGLIIINPDVVFTAQSDGVPDSDDQVNVVYLKNPSYGAIADIKEGMTMWVGSTPGAYDQGMVRVKSASGSVVSGSIVSGSALIDIAPTSEITWVDGMYLSVVREYGLWPRQANLIDGIFYCDDVVAYTNQHDPDKLKPVPVMGPDAVVYMSGSSVNFSMDATQSWVLGTKAVDTHVWSVAGSGSAIVASSGSGLAEFTFYAPGTYVINDIVTTTGGASTTGHRVVHVWNDATPPISQFELGSVQADWASGGWSFTVTLYAEVDISQVRDRARAFLVTQDYHASGSQVVHTNVGPLVGYENILASGWINLETIESNPELGTVKVTVSGPQFWLDKLGSWPAGMRNVLTTPANWNEYKYFNYDAYLWHEITWRSTVAEVMDVYRSGDTRMMVGGTGAWGTIWSQIKQMGENSLLISPCCNRYGQMFCEKDTNYLTTAERAPVPTIMEVLKVDWQDTLDFERRVTPETGFVDLTSQAWDGTINNKGTKPKRSGAWGTSVGRFGKMVNRTNLILHFANESTEQAENNELAGVLLGYDNNPLPRITMRLASSNRFFDICPHQYGVFSVAAADTPRGITLTNQKFVPRSISMDWQGETGTLFTTITAEAQSIPTHGFYLPIFTGAINKPKPRQPRTPWKRGTGGRPPFPGVLQCMALDAAEVGPYALSIIATVQTAGGVYYYDKPLHCRIRAGAATNPTRIELSLRAFQSSVSGSVVSDWAAGDNIQALTVWALNMSGSPVLQATPTPAYSGGAYGVRTYVFSSGSGMEVSGFRVQALGSGSSGNWASTGSAIMSGSAIPVVEHTFYPDPVVTTGMISGSALSLSNYPVDTEFYFKTVNGPVSGSIAIFPETRPTQIDAWGAYIINTAAIGAPGRGPRTWVGKSNTYFDGALVASGSGIPVAPSDIVAQQVDWSLDNPTVYFPVTLAGSFYFASYLDKRYGVFYSLSIFANQSWQIGIASQLPNQVKAVIDSGYVYNICQYYDPV